MKKIAKTVSVMFSVAVLAAGLLAWRIYSFGNTSSNARADAAVAAACRASSAGGA